jgi:adenylosuccinate synthase
VGNGPFPTELPSDAGLELRRLGQEYGATTGRPRRCGWFDAVAMKYSAMINGIELLAITKLDVLDRFAEIPVCIGYEVNGRRLKTFPTDLATLERAKPIFEIYEGWQSPLSDSRAFEELPEKARAYLTALARLTETRLWAVSVGPRRDQSMILP